MFRDAREVALLAFESNQSSRFLIKPCGIPSRSRFSIIRTHESPPSPIFVSLLLFSRFLSFPFNSTSTFPAENHPPLSLSLSLCAWFCSQTGSDSRSGWEYRWYFTSRSYAGLSRQVAQFLSEGVVLWRVSWQLARPFDSLLNHSRYTSNLISFYTRNDQIHR